MEDLEIWKREYNVPPREIAPVVYKIVKAAVLLLGFGACWGRGPTV
jgi:hypothetical protein